jgi:hypothetical protein
MPEGVGYSGSNVVAGTGRELNYIGNHCFAYSGEVAVNNATVTLLEFTSGAGYILAEFTQSVDYGNIGNGKFVGFNIQLNGIKVVENNSSTRNYGDNESNQPDAVRILIPPYTNVTTQGFSDQASDNPFFHSITGRIYK